MTASDLQAVLLWSKHAIAGLSSVIDDIHSAPFLQIVSFVLFTRNSSCEYFAMLES